MTTGDSTKQKHATTKPAKRTTAKTSTKHTAAGTARLELRVAPQDKQLLEHAARLTRASLSAFVLQASRQAAEDVLRRDQVTVVPPDFYDAMIASLDAPAERNEALAQAARRRQEVLNQK